AVRQRRRLLGKPDLGFGVVSRILTFACLTLAILSVASGKLYAIAGEGRTVGLGEEPLWFPKDAVAFAGQEGMPTRFVCFHNGHAALYEYLNGSYGKVYTDARLEVMGPELYGRYIDLERQISGDQGGWRQELDALGKPGILVDTVHAESSPLVATLLLDPGWRCVWFDPIAAVFVPEGAATTFPTVDFSARHFHPDPKTDPHGPSALLASTKALRNVVAALQSRRRTDRADPLILLGQGHARRALAIRPGAADGWKWLGQLEWSREQVSETPVARFRKPFDPTFDLISVRSTYTLRRALELSGDDFSTLISLMLVYQARMMNQETLQVMERLSRLSPINPSQAALLDHLPIEIAKLRATLGPEPGEGWKNLSDLNAQWNARLDAGRVASAADLLERAYRAEGRPWTVTDRLATLWLHLGEPGRARIAWQAAIKPPRPALVSARVAVTYLIEGDFDAARRAYQDALAAEPDLFEAHYALAVLERDAGRASQSLKSAKGAVEHAPTDVSKSAANELVTEVQPYAGTDPAHP
ncbi:MAG: tetratricopeptide repeat protein, partial [Isosphaeraceae bacterium]